MSEEVQGTMTPAPLEDIRITQMKGEVSEQFTTDEVLIITLIIIIIILIEIISIPLEEAQISIIITTTSTII